MKSKSEKYAEFLDSNENPLPFITPENSVTYHLLKELEDKNEL